MKDLLWGAAVLLTLIGAIHFVGGVLEGMMGGPL